MRIALIALAALFTGATHAAETVPVEDIFAAAKSIQPKVVAWRRDIHANPELGNQEVRTAKLVADHLKTLGFDVRTGVAVTGVIGVLRGGKPGGVVALRADMDALPVLEKTGLPFASTKTALWDGKTVPVAHACGHDAHVAMLMGAAELLAARRAEIPGTIMVIFQPAEEGVISLGLHGARLMLREGVLDNPAPTAIFGIHVGPADSGKLLYRSGKFLAASDRFKIQLNGQGTHGAAPWGGTDLISLASEIVLAFNTMAARQLDVVDEPSIVTVGMIHGGTRNNIIADTLEMEGTVRTFTPDRRKDVLARIERIVTSHAAAYGAKAAVAFDPNSNPPTINDPKLVADMLPALRAAAADRGASEETLYTGSEDFSYFAERVPGFFYFLGAGDPKTPLEERPVNHAPNFTIDEAAMEAGVRAHAILAWSHLAMKADSTAGDREQ